VPGAECGDVRFSVQFKLKQNGGNIKQIYVCRMSVERFEDLKCWIAARELVKLVFTACNSGKLARDFGTSDQIRRAAVSVMNNIAEGFGRSSRREFIRFLDIAQSSALEVKSMTYILDDLSYVDSNVSSSIRAKAEAKKIIRGLIHSLQTP
jgi:four helix bundle protein